MSNWKDTIIHLIVGLIKWPCKKMSKCFSKPFRSFGENINVKVDLSNYATKTDKKITHVDISSFALKINLASLPHVDISSFALKTNLACLKTEVDKLDIGKLVPVSVDLSKLSDAVKNDVVKKKLYTIN